MTSYMYNDLDKVMGFIIIIIIKLMNYLLQKGASPDSLHSLLDNNMRRAQKCWVGAWFDAFHRYYCFEGKGATTMT